MIDLRVHQRGFAALEGYPNEQGVFSCRNILPTEKVDGFDGTDFWDAERANRFGNLRERDSVGEQQREIALHGREARKRLIAAGVFQGLDRGI